MSPAFDSSNSEDAAEVLLVARILRRLSGEKPLSAGTPCCCYGGMPTWAPAGRRPGPRPDFSSESPRT